MAVVKILNFLDMLMIKIPNNLCGTIINLKMSFTLNYHQLPILGHIYSNKSSLTKKLGIFQTIRRKQNKPQC